LTAAAIDELAMLEMERVQLIAQKNDIQAQLADKNRLGPGGVRQTPEEYHHWRRRAVTALAKIEADIATNKAKLHAVTRAVVTMPSDAVGLLRSAHLLLTRLRDDGVELSPEELKVIEDVGRAIR